jgi:hypothetical protein
MHDWGNGKVVMTAVDQLSPLVGVKPARQALAVPRVMCYRWRSRRLFPGVGRLLWLLLRDSPGCSEKFMLAKITPLCGCVADG